MVKKFLWLRVQRYFPKGSGIQQPGKSRVFKNPYSKTLTVHPILARGHCGTTIWVPTLPYQIGVMLVLLFSENLLLRFWLTK